MPPKVSTLRGRADFDRLYTKGRHHRIGGLTVILAPALSEPGRVAFVASRKVGGAVARNRAKRRMRAALDRIHPNPTVDAVYSATTSVLSAPFSDVVRWMDEANHV